MSTPIRQRWDSVKDQPIHQRQGTAEEYAAFTKAISTEIPEYRAKLVKIAHGQSEISITPVNVTSVINARMGFNPLLDCRRKNLPPEEREIRDKQNKNRATKRAKQNVRGYVKAMLADHLLTFSYRENVIDRLQVTADWNRFLRLFRKRYPQWQYVSVLEMQDRGAYHIHVAVHGKQDIRWLLRCWLLAIGQPAKEVSAWIVDGVKLGDKSMGAVNVEPPKTRWVGASRQWKRDKLSGYLTKYIGKEFDNSLKGLKKYWHSDDIEKPVVERFWLKARTYAEAVIEAHDLIYYTGATSLSMWGDQAAGVVWITGETRRELIGKTTQCVPDLLH